MTASEIILSIYAALGVGIVVSYVLYLVSLSRALRRCSFSNRRLEPGLVWLQLIPVFNLVFHFYVASSVSLSLDDELRSRGMPSRALPGRRSGLAFGIVNVCFSLWYLMLWALGRFDLNETTWTIMGVTQLALGVACLVLWIVYWSTIQKVSRRLSLASNRSTGQWRFGIQSPPIWPPQPPPPPRWPPATLAPPRPIPARQQAPVPLQQTAPITQPQPAAAVRPQGARFCWSCGARIANKTYCTQCGVKQ